VLETTENNAKNPPETRRDGILRLVREKDVVHVNGLMPVFGASRAAITRGLAVLQDKGLITKTYGAVINVQRALARTHVYSCGISLRKHIDGKFVAGTSRHV
jgi:DeoR/GlpR family transcriptional regulator of sugar metabolism